MKNWFLFYVIIIIILPTAEDAHKITFMQVEIKRTIPKGSSQSKDFKTKKIFVGGIPSSTTEGMDAKS